MIETWDLTKFFGRFGAVNGMSFRVEAGEIVALLGPNGAGKTTTIRMLGAILKPTSGKASVCGHDVVAEAPTIRHIMGVLTEVPGLYSRMNAVDYLLFFARLQRVHEKVARLRIEQLLQRFDLWGDRLRPIGTYSKGMRQKIAFLRAMVHDPQVLYLDEPTSAMDPYSAKMVRDFIGELKRADRTVLICTHNLAEAELLADRIAMINRGRIVAHGTVAELKRELLGPPQFELTVASPVSEVLSVLNGGVRIDEVGDGRIRYSTTAPDRANPLILRKVVEAGGEVTGLSQVPHSLEEVYLKILEDS